MGTYDSPAAEVRSDSDPEAGQRAELSDAQSRSVAGSHSNAAGDAELEVRRPSGTRRIEPRVVAEADAPAFLEDEEGPPRSARESFPSLTPDSGPNSGPPAIIDGRYAVEDVLGEGSASIVYLCRHLVIDRLVAIKVLRQDFVQDASVRERFANEARAASTIGNEHIVETLDYGTMTDGSTYIVMELLEGYTLAEVTESEGLLEFPRILRLVRQVAQGLGAAHSAGIVHRDVKPENLFIVGRGSADFVKVLDFGVAKMASAQAAVTRAGTVFGTPHYMSPEQAEGSTVDHRADVYSVGVILYELACGEVPFDAEAPLAILTQHMTEPPRALSQRLPPHRTVPSGYEAIVLKCLSKNPAERYASMEELDADLAKVESGLSPKATLDIVKRRGLRWLLLAAVASLVTLVLLGGAWLISVSRAPEPMVQGPSPMPAEEALPTIEPLLPAQEKASTRVDLVLFPLDAHVFLGEQDLGAMPVYVDVPKGESRTVYVRRKGYISRRVVLDGTNPRVVVGLRHWKDSRWAKALEEEKAQEESQESKQLAAGDDQEDVEQAAAEQQDPPQAAASVVVPVPSAVAESAPPKVSSKPAKVSSRTKSARAVPSVVSAPAAPDNVSGRKLGREVKDRAPQSPSNASQ